MTIETAAPATSDPASTFVMVDVPDTAWRAALRRASSDLLVWSQVFVLKEYATPALPLDAKVIVDLGANVGLATLYFAARYPESRIVAVEPDPANFALLEANVRQIGDRVSPLKIAIWGDDRPLSIRRADELGDWGVRVETAETDDDAGVMGWSMPSLIRTFGLGEIDILKIDIEGAEKELFSSADLSWLDHVKMILVETHEDMQPGSEAAVARILDRGFRRLAPSGENVVFRRAAATAATPKAAGRKAIVTPYQEEDRAVLERCLHSVAEQTVAVDHILVADGHPQSWIDAVPVRHLKLDRNHGDDRNTPRGIGGLLAVAENYEGIGFLDGCNWLEPDHIAACLAMTEDYPEADFIVAQWTMRRPDGTVLEAPYKPSHVDTNCLFMLPGSFHLIPHFSMFHKEVSAIGDRIFSQALLAAGMKSATAGHPTVNVQCLWEQIYKMAGERPPVGAKPNINLSHLTPWVKNQSPREMEIVTRRLGVKLAI